VRLHPDRARARPGGGARLLERPTPRLRGAQRRLLHGLLAAVPPHDAAQGYRRGRSVATYAAPHAGQAIVLRFDLRDFFPSVRRSRVQALFRTLGYPGCVARLLTGLCTNVVPSVVLRAAPPGARVGDPSLYREPHLP